ncbi:hypothetical protein ACK36M_07885 [Aeromonas veronii]
MNELDILKKISSNLTERKSSAALSNYRVLCSNIAFLNHFFINTINCLQFMQKELDDAFKDDSLLAPQFKSGMDLNSFIPIVSRLQLNSLSVFRKLSQLTKPDDRTAVTMGNLFSAARGFDDYSNLITATRQFIDSIMSDSYQLYLLDPKSFNYHVLVSLNSFSKYATKSLSQALFNPEINSALAEFETIKFKKRSNSHITKCDHISFAEKVDFLFSGLGIPPELRLSDDLKNLFKFSSEFTHIGYTSTFFTSSRGAEVIFSDDDGPYLPSIENFSELKYEILETVCKTICHLYLPCLTTCLGKIFNTQDDEFSTSIKLLSEELSKAISSRNSEYFFFIANGLIGSTNTIPLTCMCGGEKIWQPPHETTELLCYSCGSTFKLLEVDGNAGYIITSNGPVKIIGSTVPDFDDLTETEQLKLLQQCENIVTKSSNANDMK